MRVKISDLMPDTQYYLQVRSSNGVDVSEWSQKFEVRTSPDTVVPDTPQNVTWEQVGDAFVAGWDAVNTNEEGQPSTVVRYEIVLISGADTVYESLPQMSEPRVNYELSFTKNVSLFRTPRGTVQFAVRAVDNKGLASQWSSPITAVNDPPGPVTELTAESLTDGVSLKWKAPADTDLVGYNVYVGLSPNPTSKFNDAPLPTTELNFGSSTYQTHYFRIAAVDRFNQESTPVEVSAAPLSPFGGDSEPPTEPTNFAVTISDDPAGVLLTQRALATWTASADSSLAGYHIRYKQSGETNWRTVNVPPDAEQPYLVTTGLTPNVAYDFEIRAYDAYTNKSAWVALSTNAVTPTVAPTLSHALQIAGGGYIESSSYGAGVGFRIDEDSITIHNGEINAGAVTTGVLRSSQPAIDVSGNPIPGQYAWQIDLEGDAVLGNARVRGNMVVGDEQETFVSRVQSYNYVPGEGGTGWKIDSDGWAEFRQIVSNSIHGSAIRANTLTVSNLAEGTLGVPIRLNGTLTAMNDGSIKPELYGSSVSLGPEGFFVKGPIVNNEQSTYVSFPIDGRPNIISGTLQATTLTVQGDEATGQAATFRRNSQMEPGATLTLNDSITAPVGAPLFESDAYEVSPGASVTYSGNMQAATYSASDNSIYYLTALRDSYGDYLNSIYKYDITNGGVTKVTDVAFKPSTSYDYSYMAVGLTKLGSNFYILFLSPTGVTWAVQDMGTNFVNAGFGSSNNYSNSGYCLSNDGTNLWVATTDTSSRPVFRKIDTAANVLETITTSFVIQTSSKGGMDIFSLNVGNMDFGARKFVLSYHWSTTPNEYTVNIYEDVVVFGSSGARETQNEFNLMNKGSDVHLVWKGTSPNDANGEFWQISEAQRNPRYFRYSKIKMSGRSETWGARSSYYGGAVNSETGGSPEAQTTMNARWWWNVTLAAPPAGLASRVYIRKVSTMTWWAFQATLAVGAVSYQSNTVNWESTVNTAVEFDAGVPSFIASQATFTRAYNFQTWVGSNYIEGSGFDPSLVGKLVTGYDIPAGTYVESYLSSTQMYLSQNMPSTVWAQRSIHLPKLEIRGDGYARIRELERVIIASTVDASTSSSNEPALRVGDINSNHMRIDGDELISMSSPSTQGTLYLNDGGVTHTSKLVITSTQDANSLSGNEPPLRIGDINGNHMRMDGNEIQSMSSGSSAGDLILQQVGTVRIAAGLLEVPGMTQTSSGASNINFNVSNGRLRHITSSRRWKSDIKPMALDAERLLALEPKTFKSTIEGDDQDRELIGFIAEEAHDLGLNQWVEYEEDGETPMGFGYASWPVALQQIARSQQKRIEELEARLEKVERKA